MTAATTLEIGVEVACDDPGIPDESKLRHWIAAAVDGAGCNYERLELAVRVANSAEMQSLNAEYRGSNRPTNVLSFPAGVVEGLPAGECNALGDIVVCASVVAAEARAQGKALDDHWAHMLVHGTLHLLGFDHENDVEADKMEALETGILGQLGIANPYLQPAIETHE